MVIYIIFRSISWSLADPFNGFAAFAFTAEAVVVVAAAVGADDCTADVD